MGVLFEPYVIVLLHALLKAFSDANNYVRAGANATVGLFISKLLGHDVKLVMPAAAGGVRRAGPPEGRRSSGTTQRRTP